MAVKMCAMGYMGYAVPWCMRMHCTMIHALCHACTVPWGALYFASLLFVHDLELLLLGPGECMVGHAWLLAARSTTWAPR